MKQILQTLVLLLGCIAFAAPSASAQQVLDLNDSNIQALATDLELAEVLLDYGALTVVVDPSLPSGIGLAVDCNKLQNAYDIADKAETEAQKNFDEKQKAYEDLVQQANLEPGSVSDEELDEAQKCANQAKEHLILVRSRANLLFNLLQAFGC